MNDIDAQRSYRARHKTLCSMQAQKQSTETSLIKLVQVLITALSKERNWFIMAALWNREGHYIFMLWFLSSSIYLSIFFSLA